MSKCREILTFYDYVGSLICELLELVYLGCDDELCQEGMACEVFVKAAITNGC